MRLKDILKESEDRGLTSEVKKHFLEIVSTYNKYQESMDRKSDIIEVAETLGGITEAARELALREADDWFDKHTIKRNMSELTKLGTQFDKVAKEAKNLDQRMNTLYEDMGNILSRYYKIGEISEDEMKSRLGIKESKGDCGCGCGGVTEGGCGDKSVNEEAVKVSSRNSDGSITTTIKEGMFSTLDQIRQDSENVKDFVKNVFKDRDFIKMKNDKDFIKYLKSIYEGIDEIKELQEFGNRVTSLIEKNVPTNPSKWAYYKAQAKKKFDVYPSAYANGWAAKKYKAAGGGWKKG